MDQASPLRRLLDTLQEHLKAFPSKYEGTSPEQLQMYGLSQIPDKAWRQFYQLQPGLNQKARISAALWDRVRMFCLAWLGGVLRTALNAIADTNPTQAMLLPPDLYIVDLTGPLVVQTCAELCNDGSDSGQDLSLNLATVCSTFVPTYVQVCVYIHTQEREGLEHVRSGGVERRV